MERLSHRGCRECAPVGADAGADAHYGSCGSQGVRSCRRDDGDSRRLRSVLRHWRQIFPADAFSCYSYTFASPFEQNRSAVAAAASPLAVVHHVTRISERHPRGCTPYHTCILFIGGDTRLRSVCSVGGFPLTIAHSSTAQPRAHLPHSHITVYASTLASSISPYSSLLPLSTPTNPPCLAKPATHAQAPPLACANLHVRPRSSCHPVRHVHPLSTAPPPASPRSPSAAAWVDVRKLWESGLVKSYAYISETAVDYGKRANNKRFEPNPFEMPNACRKAQLFHMSTHGTDSDRKVNKRGNDNTGPRGKRRSSHDITRVAWPRAYSSDVNCFAPLASNRAYVWRPQAQRAGNKKKGKTANRWGAPKNLATLTVSDAIPPTTWADQSSSHLGKVGQHHATWQAPIRHTLSSNHSHVNNGRRPPLHRARTAHRARRFRPMAPVASHPPQPSISATLPLPPNSPFQKNLFRAHRRQPYHDEKKKLYKQKNILRSNRHYPYSTPPPVISRTPPRALPSSPISRPGPPPFLSPLLSRDRAIKLG